MSTLVMGEAGYEADIDLVISQVDLLAGTTQYFAAPMTGYWDSIVTTVQTAVTTGGTITPKNNSQAVYATDQTQGGALAYTETIVGVAPGTPNPVAGLQVTIANTTAVGAIQDLPSTVGDPSLLVAKDAQCQLVIAGFATAGSVRVKVRFRSEALSTLAPLVM